jgi:hypothetical protein
MREAPLTDRQKTDMSFYGSCAPRVGGRGVTAQSKDGQRTRRGGGAAMNSTATELSFTRRRAMRAFVKVFVVWALGLAVLLGSSTVSLAASKLRLGSRNCYCNCSTSQNAGVGVLSWELKGNEHCSIGGKTCTFNGVSGTITQCSTCTDILVDNTLKRNCQAATVTPQLPVTPYGGVIKPPVKEGDPVPSTSPYSQPGIDSPIRQR